MISITRLLLGLDSMPGSGFLCAVSTRMHSVEIGCAWTVEVSPLLIVVLLVFPDENHRG